MNVIKSAWIAGAIAIVSIGVFLARRGPAAEGAPHGEKSPQPRVLPVERPQSSATTPKSVDRRFAESGETLRESLKNYETARTVIANNLANVETSGFKASHVVWEDIAYRHDAIAGLQDANGNLSPDSCSIGQGSRIAAIRIDFHQGKLKRSGCDLDLAIDGPGFFQVTDPSSGSTYYYRGGRFAINANGQLTVSGAYSGRLLDPAITIPSDATKVFVSDEGAVSVQEGAGGLRVAVGAVLIATFVNPQGLQQMGENMFAATEAAGPPQQSSPGSGKAGKIRQGWIESSNVDESEQIVEWKRLTHLSRTIQSLLEAH